MTSWSFTSSLETETETPELETIGAVSSFTVPLIESDIFISDFQDPFRMLPGSPEEEFLGPKQVLVLVPTGLLLGVQALEADFLSFPDVESRVPPPGQVKLPGAVVGKT